MLKFVTWATLLWLVLAIPKIEAAPIPFYLMQATGTECIQHHMKNTSELSKSLLPEIWHIEMYPNPAQEWIRITLENPIEGPVEVTLIDVRGVHLRKMTHFFKTGPLLMSREGAIAGLYFLKFQSGQHMRIQHFRFGAIRATSRGIQDQE